jgi:hypothetical protein
VQPGSAHSTLGPAIEVVRCGSSRRIRSTGGARWCRGASLAPKDSIGTGLTERGSPRWPTDSEEDSGEEAIVDNADVSSRG